MDQLTKIADSVGGWAAAIAGALIGLAVYLPKISNSIKQDSLNGNVLDRLKALEDKSVVQDKKIHKQAVRITKLVMLVIKLEGLIARSGTRLPQDVIDEIAELTQDLELTE